MNTDTEEAKNALKTAQNILGSLLNQEDVKELSGYSETLLRGVLAAVTIANEHLE